MTAQWSIVDRNGRTVAKVDTEDQARQAVADDRTGQFYSYRPAPLGAEAADLFAAGEAVEYESPYGAPGHWSPGTIVRYTRNGNFRIREPKFQTTVDVNAAHIVKAAQS